LHHLSITDPLTGLANRRHFEQAAKQELSRSKRYGSPLALLLLDLDHFKQVNDRYGHATGDRLLKAFADRLREQLRDVDLSARWGGEEFVVLMPATSPDQALLVAERLRQQIQTITLTARPLLGGAHEQLVCTVSIGVALGEMEETLLELLLHKADEGLYAAKAAGRNCLAVVKVDDPEVPSNVMSSQTGRA
jgi:diguanylate cyclase (GGDEF)-like protein